MSTGVTLKIRGSGAPIDVHIDREVVVGRAKTSDIWLPFDFVSSSHLRVFTEHGAWFVEDLGSTNGTTTATDLLIANSPVPIGLELVLMIQDLQLEFSRAQPKVRGFTLALTNSIARQLVADVAGPTGRAFIEVVSGSATGARFELPDQLIRVGLRVQGPVIVEAPEAEVFISREGEGFGFAIGEAAPRRLRNAERFVLQECTCVFFDPLEARLSPIPEPEHPVKAEPEANQTLEGEIPAPGKKIPLMALLGLAIVVGVAVLILSLFLF